MKMIQAIIRVEKTEEVAAALLAAGFPSMTKIDVYGRGKQKGVQVGTVFYDELPKTILVIVAEDDKVDEILQIVLETAKTGEQGNYGDGRIFVSEVKEAYTISKKTQEL